MLSRYLQRICTYYTNSVVHKKDLEQTLYNPKVLAPENFARFNDGILQSSLLRLATSHELDYSTTHEFSKTITHMIKNIKDHPFSIQSPETI